MIDAKRFGNKIKLPSTLQIKSEFAAFMQMEEGREKLALADGLAGHASFKAIGLHRAGLERKAGR